MRTMRLLFVLAAGLWACHANAQVIVNADGSHSVRHGNVIVGSDGKHTVVHGNVIVNPDGSHSVVLGKGNDDRGNGSFYTIGKERHKAKIRRQFKRNIRKEMKRDRRRGPAAGPGE
jgi:hypothetical protein